MELILQRIADLLKIKNIITLVTIYVFARLALTSQMDVKDVGCIILMIFTYFFNKDVKDKKGKEND